MSKSKNSDSNQEFKVPPAFKFQEGEKVLCFHGPLIYEAKCLQARYDEEEKTNKYHIHYSGWNKSWDEWVPESRVLKHNEGNIQRQKELHKAQKAEPKGKKGKKRSVTGKEKEADGKEKDADDSRSSTPVNEKGGGGGGGGGKASASATQSSSQESASDIPKRKRSKLDPSVETFEPATLDKKDDSDKKDPAKASNLWKVNLVKPNKTNKKRQNEGGSGRSSPVKNVSAKDKASPDKKISPEKKKVDKNKSPRKSISLQNTSSPSKHASPKNLSPTKLYPVLKGRKLSVNLKKLDLESFDNQTGKIKPSPVNGEIDELTMFGAYVVDQLRQISDQSKLTAMKIKIQKLLTSKT